MRFPDSSVIVVVAVLMISNERGRMGGTSELGEEEGQKKDDPVGEWGNQRRDKLMNN